MNLLTTISLNAPITKIQHQMLFVSGSRGIIIYFQYTICKNNYYSMNAWTHSSV